MIDQNEQLEPDMDQNRQPDPSENHPSGAVVTNDGDDASLTTLSAGAIIPWERKDELGGFYAYWLTVWFVITRLGKLDADPAAPISLDHAKQFRRKTMIYVTATLLIAALVPLTKAFESSVAMSGRFFDSMLMSGVIWAGMILFVIGNLWACTQSITWFFASKKLSEDSQDRAIASGCYASAPLILIGLLAVILAVLIEPTSMRWFQKISKSSTTRYLGKLPSLAIMALWYVIILRTVYFAMARSVKRTV